MLLRKARPGLGRRRGFYVGVDVILASVRQRSLNGPTMGLVPSGNKWR